MKNHKECIVCNSTKIKALKHFYKKHQLVKCKHCGLVFMERIPTVEELNDYYAGYSYTSEGYLSPVTIKSYNVLLDEFEKYRKHNKILDVGCGRGWFLQEAKKRGWEVYGTEYSDAAIKLCESDGLKMTQGQLQSDTFLNDEFDIITSFEVLEHINNPNEDMDYIYKFLRKGGLFYCTTPNFNAYLRFYLKAEYNIIVYPEHLTYYTKRTLKKLMKRHKFKTSKMLTTGISVSHLRTSVNKTSEKLNSEESSDEKLRQKISNKWYLGVIKVIANKVLTIFGIGMTLKGYFIK